MDGIFSAYLVCIKKIIIRME